MLIGRNKEITLLNDALKSNKPELIVVYGRRRVGKTYLVRQVYDNKICFEISGLHEGKLTDQLENFYRIINSKMSKTKTTSTPKGWQEAFGLLIDYLETLDNNNKKVLFFDEFPWLATSKSKFLMSFENFWNSYASRRNDLVVIICGSAASYMVSKIIRNKGGLHNRITQLVRLNPFTLHETEQFLVTNNIKYTRYDILQLYMTIGGVPFYLEKLKKGESVPQAIDRLCFSKDGTLVNEFNNIYESLFENHERHVAVIKSLSEVRKGLTRNELVKRSKLSSGGTFTKIIEELIESGFVEQYKPFGKKVKDTLYRLSDEYSMFYLKFIKDNKTSGMGTWNRLFLSNSFTSWLGFSFETLCMKHIDQIKSALGLSVIYSESAGWTGMGNGKGAQIDLLIDRADNVINICEMKFSSASFTITKKYADEIRNKLNVFHTSTQTKKNLFFTMITTYGVEENSYYLELVQNSVDMNSLFL